MTLKFVLSTNSAFRICENKEFSELVSYLSCSRAQLPTTKTLMIDIETKYQYLKTLLIGLIDTASYVCLTADGWTNSNRSFMGITVHFFDEKLLRHSYLLAFRRMIGRHTFQAIKEMLILVIKEFKMKVSKITHIVTDGASNFEKAFKVYGPTGDVAFVPIIEGRSDLECLTNEAIGVDDMSNEVDFESLDSDSVYFPPDTESIDIDLDQHSDEDNDDEDDDMENRLPKQLKCQSHKLNRLGIDFEKSLFGGMKPVYDILNVAFTKLKKFWNLNSRSSVAHEIIFRVCNRSFPYPNATRWNSKYDSIDLAEKNKQKINEAIDEINAEATKNTPRGKKYKKLEKLSASDWRVLKDYALCMGPVAMGLDILQGDKQSSQGYILPVLFGIKASLQENIEMRRHVSENGQALHNIVMECFEKRFGDAMKICEENKSLILAAAIHPKFKLSWLQCESDREFVQSQLINACIDLSTSMRRNNPTDDPNQINELEKANSNECTFFKHLRTNENLRRSSTDDSITLEVFQYIVQPLAEPSLNEFRGSNVLEEMFRYYNTTLSSSAAIERIFSKALIILSQRRNRTSDENAEKSLFIKQNGELLTK